MQSFNTVVISDLHLGARNSRTGEILRFLCSVRTDRIILAGDLFNHPRLRGLQPEAVRVVDALRELGRTIRVDWLLGNHDPPADWFAGLLGIATHDEVHLDVGGKRYLVYHGHGWDPSLEWPQVVVGTADAIYAACQWLDPTHRLAQGLKRRSKHFCRAVAALRRNAIEAGRIAGLAGVILGHSHVACDERSEGIHYLNCGCWTEKPATFVGVRGGAARLYHWDRKTGEADEATSSDRVREMALVA